MIGLSGKVSKILNITLFEIHMHFMHKKTLIAKYFKDVTNPASYDLQN